MKVKSNKGKGGIDGMQVDELLPYLKGNQSEIIREIREGRYKPNPVRRVEIPKEEKGKARKLGIPTVVDRLIQQAVTQRTRRILTVPYRRFESSKACPTSRLNCSYSFCRLEGSLNRAL